MRAHQLFIEPSNWERESLLRHLSNVARVTARLGSKVHMSVVMLVDIFRIRHNR
jgi:hypothetical protein